MKTYSLRTSLLLLLFSFFLLQGCEEEEEVHPEIQTMEITALSPSTATLKGNVITKGKFPVLDYGFVYGFSPDLNEANGTKASLGKDAQPGIYTEDVSALSIPNNYYYNRTLYARAYLRNEKGTVFGQVASVMLPSPSVQSIIPSSGKAGDRITINGTFFASSPNEVEVTFGGVTARVVEVTPSKIVVEVPAGITSNSYYSYNQVQVVLRMANENHNVTSDFRITPTVSDFSPKSGPLGTTITISGENLPSSYYYNSSISVLIGQTAASISSYSSNGIQVVVPNSISVERAAISVIIDGVTTILPGEFTVTPHTVTSISPASGLPGSSFSIYGSNFPYNYYYGSHITVKIGETIASVYQNSTGELTASIPPNMQPGSYAVKVTAGPHTVEAPQQYQVLAPAVTSFAPTSGGIGKEVVISGTFVSGAYYTVYFGSVQTSAYSSSSTSLPVHVPGGVDAGSVKIKVQHGDTMLEAPGNFTVLAPSIASFTPSSGVAGSEVVITGSGFTPHTYYTAVKFGTIATSILSITENTIRVVVPSGVTGAVKINVIHNGQTIISNDNFTVTN
ncbi:IPT/TIG domain-containing protein [Pontibacter pamirensis]|uniref:IPT/TIG domain-containing protein n=1 Tax=Pontibacter pamirensis TaxID=2562824 RepID=UPI00138A0C9E|nr:IPT/TIG domain-containing protein [Pontibacter pamirensis]